VAQSRVRRGSVKGAAWLNQGCGVAQSRVLSGSVRGATWLNLEVRCDSIKGAAWQNKGCGMVYECSVTQNGGARLNG
jgi:hypothetical protein